MRLPLQLHPASRCDALTGLDVEVARVGTRRLLLRYYLSGNLRQISFPRQVRPARRTDELWRHTCFECFLRPVGSETYQEYNFSPSGGWAAYAFDGYRRDMRDLALVVEPWVGRDEEAGPGTYAWDVDLDLSHVPDVPLQLGLSAVIEEKDGQKSYWALAHPPGAPDFHHPDCFALELLPAR